jgi:glyoxylase-like metal-dependent hydrolase (beta-lactamase superfamily II)
MCELHAVKKVGRRIWLARSASGLVALWSALEFGFGRQGWGVLLGGAPTRVASAQETGGARVLPVQIEFEFEGQLFPVAAYVLVRGNEAAIVDTLTPGNADRIGAVMQAAGLSWSAVRHVILTHYHFDHAGSAADVASQTPQAAVWAGAADIPEIPLQREIRPAADGAEVFGLRIVATPGHTAGHISVLDPAASTLVLGDAAFNFGGQLMDIIPEFTADAAQARASLRKLGAMNIERALFAHGPPIERGASAAFTRLVAATAPAPAPAAAPVAQPSPTPTPAPRPAPAPAPEQVPRTR